MRIGDVGGVDDDRTDRAEGVAALGLDRRAVEADFRQGDFVDRGVAADVLHGLGFGNAAGALADHHAQRRTGLDGVDAGREDDVTFVADHSVRGLDIQHRGLRRGLVRVLVELGNLAVQQALVVQRDAEHGAAERGFPGVRLDGLAIHERLTLVVNRRLEDLAVHFNHRSAHASFLHRPVG
ncbi:hypothetical protein D9M71_358300 [compost metagenome]